MDDAEALEAFDGLGGEHGRAVVGEQGAGQSALVEGLREAVDERVGGLVEVPLQVAAEARAIVEDAEQRGFFHSPVGGEDGARALVEVQVPESVDVTDLERARLARREVGVAVRAAVFLARAKKALVLHVAAARSRSRASDRACGSSRASATRLS